MSLKTRLTKLEDVALATWREEWDKFTTLFAEVAPKCIYEFADEDASEFIDLPPDAREVIWEKEISQLYEVTKLERSVWEPYLNHLQRLESVFDENAPVLSRLPGNLPLPPSDPSQAVEILKTLEYPLNDYVGWVRYEFCLVVTGVLTIWKFQKANTP
jgi:hypothetical protein